MSSFLDRLKEVTKSEGLTREDLAEKIGVRYTRINNVMNGRGNIKSEEIELIGKAFPNFKYWLVFGEELPEAGQISPMTKRTADDYQEQGKAG